MWGCVRASDLRPHASRQNAVPDRGNWGAGMSANKRIVLGGAARFGLRILRH